MEGIYTTGGILFWGCTFGGVYIPCVYSHARWSTVDDSGLCCCVPCLSSAIISLRLCFYSILKMFGQVVMMEWMLFFRNMGKAEGEGEGLSLRQLEFCFDASLFVICLFVCFRFFVHWFSSSPPYSGANWVWIEYSITLFVCLCLRLSVLVDLLYNHFCAGREFKNNLRPFK